MDERKTSKILKPQYGIFHPFFAVKNALCGVKTVFLKENAFRWEVALVLVLSFVAVFSDKSTLEKLFLIMSLWGVLIVELLNSAVEYTVDLVTEDYHILAKYAKDAAAGAVLLSVCGAIVVWGIVFCPF